MEIKRTREERETNVTPSSRIWHKFSEFSSVPKDVSLELLLCHSLLASPQEEYKNSARQRNGTLWSGLPRGFPVGSRMGGPRNPTWKSQAPIQKGTSWSPRKGSIGKDALRGRHTKN